MCADRMKVILCWHMHQPQYCDMTSGNYVLPWTYLHAMKDYVDMAAFLEADNNARVVVNFAPILLEQIDDYSKQLRNFLDHGGTIHDPLLAALAQPILPEHKEQRLDIIHQCLRANEERLIKPNRTYLRLVTIARQLDSDPDMLHYLDDRFFVDIMMWYHLVWIAESVHRSDSRIRMLVEKGQDYSLHDRQMLIQIIAELIESVIPRYKKLAEQGRIELSMNPYAHPILPLLIDINSALEAMPDAELPHARQYPDGIPRARWHIEEGLRVFEKYFGMHPKGIWSSEGAVSTAAVKMFSEYGLKWTASGESVLRGSLARAQREHEVTEQHGLYKPYIISDSQTACFFRDDGLSDLIGFSYSGWHGDDAVADLINHLEGIAATCHEPGKQVVSIILDGENAWEHFPNNGYYFLSALYKQLGSHEKLEMTTFSDCLDSTVELGHIDELQAGSWVYGTFSTWIGDNDKNRGWDMLIEAKRAYDVVMASKHMNDEQRAAATRQLAICEGSDWFWWFGDYNPADTVSDFEHLFRLHLVHLYGILGVEPPESLTHAISHGSGVPEHGGAMRRGQQD